MIPAVTAGASIIAIKNVIIFTILTKSSLSARNHLPTVRHRYISNTRISPENIVRFCKFKVNDLPLIIDLEKWMAKGNGFRSHLSNLIVASKLLEFRLKQRKRSIHWRSRSVGAAFASAKRASPPVPTTATTATPQTSICLDLNMAAADRTVAPVV